MFIEVVAEGARWSVLRGLFALALRIFFSSEKGCLPRLFTSRPPLFEDMRVGDTGVRTSENLVDE